jgi:hypothetical protein
LSIRNRRFSSSGAGGRKATEELGRKSKRNNEGKKTQFLHGFTYCNP